MSHCFILKQKECILPIHAHEPLLSVACSRILRPSQLFQFQNETKFQGKKELHVTVCKCHKSFWDIKHQSSYNSRAVGKTQFHGEFDRWQKDSLALVQSSQFQGLETWKTTWQKTTSDQSLTLVLTSAGFFCSFAGVFDLLLYLEQEEKEVEGPVKKTKEKKKRRPLWLISINLIFQHNTRHSNLLNYPNFFYTMWAKNS